MGHYLLDIQFVRFRNVAIRSLEGIQNMRIFICPIVLQPGVQKNMKNTLFQWNHIGIKSNKSIFVMYKTEVLKEILRFRLGRIWFVPSNNSLRCATSQVASNMQYPIKCRYQTSGWAEWFRSKHIFKFRKYSLTCESLITWCTNIGKTER